MKKLVRYYNKIISYIISNRLFLSYVVLSITGTTILRLNTVNRFSPFAFFTDLGIILLIGALGYFRKGKNQFRYYFFVLIFFTIVEIVNAIYYVFYTDFSSFGDIASLSQAETVTGSIMEKMRISYLIYLIFPVVFYFVHNKLNKSSYYNYIAKVEKTSSMLIGTLIGAILAIVISFSHASGTDFSRINKQWNKNYLVERFGILFYQGNDLFQTIRPKISSLFGYDDALKIFNEYFSNPQNLKYRDPNKYTGILSGKNVVFVHMEGMQDFLMNESFNNVEVTPFLNALAKEGMFFSNFYPEVSTGTSSDTEFTLASSLMPASSGTVFVSYYKNKYNSIQNILKDNGYYTFSSHGNLASMWNRNKAHPSLGYQDMFFEESFTYTKDDVINLGINDKLFFEQLIPIMENIEQNHPDGYMGTVITLSNHSPFKFLDQYGEYDLSVTKTVYNKETLKNETYTKDYISGTDLGNYIKSVHYADSALGDFINYIKNSEYFNDTVFVFYGDHDAKISRREISRLYNYDITKDDFYSEGEEGYFEYDSFMHELNKKTPLIIWTKNNTLKRTLHGKVDYYMGMIDVAPTILNMLGLKNEYALGHDIFSIKNNNVIPFPNGNFITNKLYYNNSTGVYKILNENTIIDEKYIEDKKDYVEKLLEVSNSMIIYDLLNPREDKIDE